ncbi:MAG: TIGR02302 family protein, partial [Pseudomonadota bacterium]
MRNPGSLRLRAAAWSVLSWESLWPLLVPLFLTICVFLTFSWAGGWRYLHGLESNAVIWLVRGGFVAAFVASLYPIRKFAKPSDQEITTRIEQRSGLADRPMTAQTDELAMGTEDEFAFALWREHRARMAERLQDMTAGTPAPKANRFDPFALRAMVPVLVFAALFFSYSPLGGRVADVYAVPQTTEQLLTRMDAWINPPSYTRKPPIYLSLNQDGQTARGLNVPEGSEFFLRFVGEGDVSVTTSVADGDVAVTPKEKEASAAETEFSFILEDDTVVRLNHRENVLAQWGITLLPDEKPEILFSKHPSSALSGSLELSYSVKDDYGVVSAEAEIKSLEAVGEGARPIVEPPKVDLPLPRFRAKKGISNVNRDLTEHPWAGGKVSIRLKATDDPGQVGYSETREITLPGRRFSKPLAQAIVEQRRILAMDANQQQYVANLLDAVSTAPPEFIDDTSAFLGMRAAYRRLVDARNDDQLRSVVDLLWEIALGIEFGDLSEAERNLREAQEALSDALERGASQEEIDRLMQELRQAMNEMMQALAEQARQNPQQTNPFDQSEAQTLTQNDLERMMDRIEDLARSGSQDAARQLLSELQRMMDNLRAGRHEQQRQAEGNELNQALDELSELMQRQQELLNESFRMR